MKITENGVLRSDGWIPRVLVLAVAGSVACNSGPREVSHPQSSLVIRPPGAVADTIERGERDALASLSGLDALADGTPVDSVGVENGAKEYTFGRITDAEAFPERGRVLIADAQSVPRLYSDEGELLQSLGRRGLGPQEFQSPRRIATADGRHVFISDFTSSLKVFRWSEADTLVHDHNIQLDRTVGEFCVLGDTIYTVEATVDEDGGAIHAYDVDGRSLGKFGKVYRSEKPIVRQNMSEGKIACDRVTGRVIFAANRLPEIRGFDPDGELAWVTLIARYRAPKMVEAGRRFQYRIPEDGAHIGYTVEDVAGPGVLVQYALAPHSADRRRTRDLERFDTYVLDARSGDGAALGLDPGRLRASTPSLAVTNQHLPYPRFIVWREETGS